MVRFIHALALLCSLASDHHTPHASHIDVDLVLEHVNHKRAIARCL